MEWPSLESPQPLNADCWLEGELDSLFEMDHTAQAATLDPLAADLLSAGIVQRHDERLPAPAPALFQAPPASKKERSHAARGNSMCLCCSNPFVAVDGGFGHYNLKCHTTAAAHLTLTQPQNRRWVVQTAVGVKRNGTPKFSVLHERDRTQPQPDGTVAYVLPGLLWQSRLCEMCRPLTDMIDWDRAPRPAPPPPVTAMPMAAAPPPMTAAPPPTAAAPPPTAAAPPPMAAMPPPAATPPPMAAQSFHAGAAPTVLSLAGIAAAAPAGTVPTLATEMAAATPIAAMLPGVAQTTTTVPTSTVPTELAYAVAVPAVPAVPLVQMPRAMAMPTAKTNAIESTGPWKPMPPGWAGHQAVACNMHDGGESTWAHQQLPQLPHPPPPPTHSPMRPMQLSPELQPLSRPQPAQASAPMRVLKPGTPSSKGFVSGLPLRGRADLIPRGNETASEVLNCFGVVVLAKRGHILSADARAQLWAVKVSHAECIENGDDRLRMHWPKDRQAATAWKARPTVLGNVNAELSAEGLSRCEPLGMYASQHRVATDARGIFSLAGCQEQPHHGDARAGRLLYFEKPDGTGGTSQIVAADMPLTGYITPELHSRLPCFPQGCGGPRVELQLEENDFTVFRGDFVHAGPGFAASDHGTSSAGAVAPIIHRRVHCYIDSPAWHRPADHFMACHVAADADANVPLDRTMTATAAAAGTLSPVRKRARAEPGIAASVPSTAVAPAAASATPATPMSRQHQLVRPRQSSRALSPLRASPLCNNDHAMVASPAEAGQKCDGCGCAFAAEQLAWTCGRNCDFDLCETCGDARMITADPSYTPPPRGSLRMSRAPAPQGSAVPQRPQSPSPTAG